MENVWGLAGFNVRKMAQNWHSRADDMRMEKSYTGIVPNWDGTADSRF